MSIAFDAEAYRPLIEPRQNGTSDESNLLVTRIKEQNNIFLRPVSHGTPYYRCMDALNEVYLDASQPNWDGYGGLPITDRALEDAKTFIEIFTMRLHSFPTPDIVPEPDGEIGLEWYTERNDSLSISIGEKGEIAFAVFKGSEKNYGTIPFSSSIPDTIIHWLNKLYS